MRTVLIWLAVGVVVALLAGIWTQNGVADLTPSASETPSETSTPTTSETPEMPETGTEMGNDEIPLPPTAQVITSENGQYALEITASDGWDSTAAIATLYQIQGDAASRQLLWQRSLPHSYGPKYALVGSQGQVALLDEWINVASPYAVMVIDRNNQILSQASFDQLQAVLSVPRHEIVDQARQGWWISAPPKMNVDQAQVIVKTAGKQLAVDLSTGELAPE